MIRIGVDCRALAKNRAGIGRYLYEILQELALLDNEVQFYLYSNRPCDIPQLCIENPRFFVRYKKNMNGVLWLHTVLPLWLFRDNIDIFWGPSYSAPLIRFYKYRCVITIHDTVYARFPKSMRWLTWLHNRIMLPIYIRIAHEILTDSKFSRKEIIEVLDVSPRNVSVIELAATGFGVEDHALIIERPYIFYVGTMEPRKNVENLVAAYSSLPDEVKQKYNLVLAGSIGWGGVRPSVLFRKYLISENAIYLGRVSDEELSNLYNHSTAFIFPSIYEGFGLPVLEAMSCGVPVICSNGSALGEITQGAALYCNVSSVSELSRTIKILLNDCELQIKLSELGRARAALYNWSNTAEKTLNHLIGGHENDTAPKRNYFISNDALEPDSLRTKNKV